MNASDCMVLQAQEFIPWNNPDNLVSFHVKDTIWKVKSLILLPILFLISVPANAMNIAVFYKHGLKERINVCMFALSLADGLYLAVNMLIEGEQLVLHFTSKERTGPVVEWIINHHLLGFYGFSWVSQILSAIVASERCFCIIRPLKSQTVLHASTMIAIIVAVFVVVLGLRFLVVSRYHMVYVYDPFRDRFTRVVTGGQFYYDNQQLVDFLDIFVYGLGIPWVVIAVVITTTVITVIKLRQTAEWRAGISSSRGTVSARDIALTRMLVGNSIFFVVCVFPVGLFRVSLFFLPEMNTGRRHHNMFAIGIGVCNVLSYINSTFNIVVYYTMGSRYRQTVRTLLCRKSTKNTPSNISVLSQNTMSTSK